MVRNKLREYYTRSNFLKTQQHHREQKVSDSVADRIVDVSMHEACGRTNGLITSFAIRTIGTTLNTRDVRNIEEVIEGVFTVGLNYLLMSSMNVSYEIQYSGHEDTTQIKAFLDSFSTIVATRVEDASVSLQIVRRAAKTVEKNRNDFMR